MPRTANGQLAIGTRVRTTQEDLSAADTYDGERTGLRWGVEGEVIDSSDAHGLCYTVYHDGTHAVYEPTELEEVV